MNDIAWTVSDEFFLHFSPNMLLSGSRDKSLIIWNLTRDEQAYGYPKRSLQGHSHIVSDCVCSPNFFGKRTTRKIGGYENKIG